MTLFGSLLLLSTFAGASCATPDDPATGPGSAPAGDPANVVVIVIDTLRADRLSCYGYARKTTPHLDALAAKGLRFERAYGTAPWTLPSTASLMSGLQPDVHRASSFLASISPQARLLAEELAEAGYATAGIIGNYFVQSLFGFGRGFESYDGHCMADRAGVNSDQISDRAVAWLAMPHARPFLLYLHYFDPHYNYIEHEGFRFGGEDTDRVFSGEDVYELRDHLKELDAADKARLDALYDSEVAFTDHHVGRVLAELDRLGLSESTYVVVTSDHGEALGEHGWIGHTVQLYEESVRIPLIVAGPGIAPEVRGDVPVQLDDLFVPLLRLARGDAAGSFASAANRGADGLQPDEALIGVQTSGLDEPESARPAKLTIKGSWRLFVDRDASGEESYRLFDSSAPKGKRRKRPEDFPAQMKLLLETRAEEFARRKQELADNGSVLTRRRALVKGTAKLIVDEAAGTLELYDLAKDPLERDDLAAREPERAAELKRRLDEIVAALAATALAPGSGVRSEDAEEARRKIEQIGYGRER